MLAKLGQGTSFRDFHLVDSARTGFACIVAAWYGAIGGL